ncbi:MAG: TlpA family protein disulfide reductase [Deltaproteobacteria bacterium]|nr:TlpA family protein disulfide reductase [Deltaproteobacteria bacterium]
MEEKQNIENETKGLPTPILVGIAVAVLLVIVLVVVFGRSEKFKPVDAGMQATEFTLPDLKGQMKSLKDYRGKVVFLNFWATWCKPCREEMPSMQEVYTTLMGQKFEILAVSIDKDGAEVIEKFVKEYGLTFPILHDRKGVIKEVYKTTGVPETFIIDQNGVIAEKIMGPRDWRDERNLKIILELLKNGPKSPEEYKKGKRQKANG